MLDPITQSQIWNFLLAEVKERKIGLLVVSHDEKLMEQVVTAHAAVMPANKKKNQNIIFARFFNKRAPIHNEKNSGCNAALSVRRCRRQGLQRQSIPSSCKSFLP